MMKLYLLNIMIFDREVEAWLPADGGTSWRRGSQLCGAIYPVKPKM